MDYAYALEKRAEYLHWANSEDSRRIYGIEQELAERLKKHLYGVTGKPRHALAKDLLVYEQSLKVGETYFMNRNFAALVDTARRTVPDDLAFDDKWLVSKSGWMWLEEPFETPQMQIKPQDVPPDYEVPEGYEALPPPTPDEKFRIAAVSWARLDHINLYSGGNHVFSAVDQRRVDVPGATHFMVWLDRKQMDPRLSGFGMWSYFTILPGEKVIDRIRAFEHFASEGTEGQYISDKTTDMLHEIRWVYTAMHLMSLKLATTVKHDAPRHTRRRFAREKTPVEPWLKVVTLRRMEEEKAHAIAHGIVDWQWQWRVEGHWRNQPYSSTGEYRRIWIEDYIKGPADKPLKPAQAVIYKAAR